jgi:hypothetical protein
MNQAAQTEYERFCIFCGTRFLAHEPRAVFCCQDHQQRELQAIWMLEATTPKTGRAAA